MHAQQEPKTQDVLDSSVYGKATYGEAKEYYLKLLATFVNTTDVNDTNLFDYLIN